MDGWIRANTAGARQRTAQGSERRTIPNTTQEITAHEIEQTKPNKTPLRAIDQGGRNQTEQDSKEKNKKKNRPKRRIHKREHNKTKDTNATIHQHNKSLTRATKRHEQQRD
jgi:hypothetical protein